MGQFFCSVILLGKKISMLIFVIFSEKSYYIICVLYKYSTSFFCGSNGLEVTFVLPLYPKKINKYDVMELFTT